MLQLFHRLVMFALTVSETLKWFSSLSILMHLNHSGGDSVVLGIVPRPPPPPPQDLSSSGRYFSRDKSSEQRKEGRKSPLGSLFAIRICPAVANMVNWSRGENSLWLSFTDGSATYWINWWMYLQYNTTLLPSVNTTAVGMFRGAKYTHCTFMPIIKL